MGASLAAPSSVGAPPGQAWPVRTGNQSAGLSPTASRRRSSRRTLLSRPDSTASTSGAPEVLSVLSGRESSVRRLDLLREAVGDNPADWFPALTGHAWPGGTAIEDDGVATAEALRLAAE